MYVIHYKLINIQTLCRKKKKRIRCVLMNQIAFKIGLLEHNMQAIEK